MRCSSRSRGARGCGDSGGVDERGQRQAAAPGASDAESAQRPRQRVAVLGPRAFAAVSRALSDHAGGSERPKSRARGCRHIRPASISSPRPPDEAPRCPSERPWSALASRRKCVECRPSGSPCSLRLTRTGLPCPVPHSARCVRAARGAGAARDGGQIGCARSVRPGHPRVRLCTALLCDGPLRPALG